MSLSSIIGALEDALETVSGVATVDLTQPETPPTGSQLPAIVGIVTIPDISMAGADLRSMEYQIELFYLSAERGGNAKAQRDAILDKPGAIVATLDANATLGAKVYGIRYGEPAATFDAVDFRDKSYVGFQMTLLLKEKYAATITA